MTGPGPTHVAAPAVHPPADRAEGAGPHPGALLEVEGLSKRFAGIQALGGDGGLSFQVGRGSFVGLIGPNGAGKSTLFNLLSGVLPADTGTVVFDGSDITDDSSHQRAEHGIGRTFQTPRTFESLTVLDNVVVGATSPGERLRAALGRKWRRHEAGLVEQARDILDQVGLADRASEPVGDLSGGELRMLGVARQLIRRPTLLLLDEPTAGVHPLLQDRLSDLLIGLHRQGMTLVVVEHNLHFLLAIAEHILVLTQGRLLAEGTPSHIRNDPAVISAYLGEDHAA